MLRRCIKFFLCFLSAYVIFKIFADFLTSSEFSIAVKSICVIIISISVILTILFGKLKSPLTLKSFAFHAILIGTGLYITLKIPKVPTLNSFTDYLIASISLIGNCCIMFPAIILTIRFFCLFGQKNQSLHKYKPSPKSSPLKHLSVPSKHIPKYMFEDELSDAVLIKNKTGELIDKTYSVRDITKNNGFYEVRFNNAKKPYRYGTDRIVWLQNPILLDPETTFISVNGSPVYPSSSVYSFGNYIRVISKKGFSKLYPADQVEIESSCLEDENVRNIFEYLKAISSFMNVQSDGSSLLQKHYDRITKINPDSVLGKYLQQTRTRKRKPTSISIYPYGCNISQMHAVKHSISRSISVIEGPPGTGKTQTILNIIANAMLHDKTVSIVSNNNAAIQNVLDKLESEGLSFFAALLGNRSNKTAFFEANHSIPKLSDWRVGDLSVRFITLKLILLSIRLRILLSAKNKYAALQLEYDRLIVEQLHFTKQTHGRSTALNPHTEQLFTKWNSHKIIAFLVRFDIFMEQNSFDRLSAKLVLFLFYRLKNFSTFHNEFAEISLFLHSEYYIKRLEELQKSKSDLEKRLKRNHFDHLMKSYQDYSMRLFKNKLYQKFNHLRKAPKFDYSNFKKEFDTFVQYYPVVLSTTHSIANSHSANYLFDYLIIDEASQVDLVTGCLALNSCRNAVVVGDSRQLQPIIESELKKKTESLALSYSIPDAYDFNHNSILSSVKSVFGSSIPATLLREHYRCHPRIIEFCNQKFYNDELIIMTEKGNHKFPLHIVKTVPGNHARGNADGRGSKYNQRQIDIIRDELLPSGLLNTSLENAGIVAPYRRHVNKAADELKDLAFEIDTVHKYQGREKKAMIFCTVANAPDAFNDAPDLINVAVSRAKDQLIVISPGDYAKHHGSNIGDLMRYIEYNAIDENTVIESKITSVFDLLYKNYSSELSRLNRSLLNRLSERSEKIMDTILYEFLSMPKFQSLSYDPHQRLSLIVNPEQLKSALNEREYDYLMNPNTHLDFVVFNKLDKQPVLAIEVDGVKHHENNPDQLKRDAIKDKILELAGLRLLRFATNGSGERGRLLTALNEIVKDGVFEYVPLSSSRDFEIEEPDEADDFEDISDISDEDEWEDVVMV